MREEGTLRYRSSVGGRSDAGDGPTHQQSPADLEGADLRQLVHDASGALHAVDVERHDQPFASLHLSQLVLPAAVTAIGSVLDEAGTAYRTGKTWTTDGLYRETPEKVARRRAEGCLTVEMECSALCAVARFRGVTFGQILYGGDDVSRLEWDRRDWDVQTAVRERLLPLAAQACLRIPD